MPERAATEVRDGHARANARLFESLERVDQFFAGRDVHTFFWHLCKTLFRNKVLERFLFIVPVLAAAAARLVAKSICRPFR